jgi:hypothetical protein
MQNQAIDMLDYLQIETCKTYTELYNQLRFSLEKKKREAEKQMQIQQMMMAAQQEQQAQVQENMAAAKEEGNNYRAELKAEAEMAQSIPQQQPQVQTGQPQ